MSDMIISFVTMAGNRSRCIVFFIVAVFVALNVFRIAIAQTTQNMSVTATVPANSASFPVTLVQNTPGARFPQDTQLSYTITYGSSLLANVDLTLVASWSRGTLSGESSPSLDIIDYVPGSASNAYNSTPPVIDTVNRTITWTIVGFPALTTTEQVTFKLTTNHSYTGATVSSFTVSAHSTGASATSPTSSVTKEYLYDASLEPTATPTVTPTPTPTGPPATPGPQPSSSPTPTPTTVPQPSDLPFRFTDIGLETISPTSASIRVLTTQTSTAVLTYGTATNALTETVSDLSSLKRRVLRLSGLRESTRYYFRVTAKNALGSEIKSDLYTLVTGRRGEAPIVDRGRTIITSAHILLYPSADNTFVIPVGQNYELNLVFSNSKTIRKVLLSVGDLNVLAAASDSPPHLNSRGGEMREIEAGKYIARLVSPLRNGTYPLALRVSDTSGNITDMNLGQLKAIQPLTILSKTTGRPVEHARVKLSFWNYRTGAFEFISPQVLPIPNPLYSNHAGHVTVILPQGRYRAEISTILNKPARREFVIGPGKTEGFPAVYLEAEPFSPIAFIRYQWETCMDALATLRAAMASVSNSLRLFELNAYVLLFFFVVLTYISLSRRLKIPLRSFIHHMKYRLKANQYSAVEEKKITGKVVDSASKEALIGADVYLIDPRHNTVLSHTTTRAGGVFTFPVYDTHRYVIDVMKSGFEPNRFHEDTLEAGPEGYLLEVTKHARRLWSLKVIVDTLLSVGLELLIVLSFMLEIVFSYVFGLPKTAPFIVLSLFNLFLVTLHSIRIFSDRNK